jgi:2-phosphoglycerate kinase
MASHDIVQISGATGTGKSTVARHVASKLGIHHVVSTDVVRGVMRSIVTSTVAPALHADSFAVPHAPGAADRGMLDTNSDGSFEANIAGFLEQARVVRAGVDEAIAQMLREDTGLVVEGVHLVPDVRTSLPDGRPVPMVLLAALDPDAHRAHFAERNVEGRRPPGRYLRNFERIRAVQDFLVERAHAGGVPIVDTTGAAVEDTVSDVLDAIDLEFAAAQSS